MKCDIETRRDYELHVINLVNKKFKDSQTNNVLVKLMMGCFDDGVAYHANNGGYVEVKGYEDDTCGD